MVFRLRKSRKGTIVLGKKDAAKLAKDPAAKKLMQKGQVVVIVDSRVGGIEGARPRETPFRLAMSVNPGKAQEPRCGCDAPQCKAPVSYTHLRAHET